MPIIESLGHLFRRLRRAMDRTTFERQLDGELRFHVDAESAALMRRGVEPAEARRQALAALGGMDRWRDEVGDTRATSALETLFRDVLLPWLRRFLSPDAEAWASAGIFAVGHLRYGPSVRVVVVYGLALA